MIYEIHQITEYHYTEVVPSARHVIRLLPVTREGQTVIHARVLLDPPPANRVETRDFFGNAVLSVYLDGPHDDFIINTVALVRIEPPLPLLSHITPAWESVSVAAFTSTSLLPDSPVHFLYASRRIPLVAVISDYAHQSFPARQAVLSSCMDLMRRIHSDFIYDPAATDVTTSPEDAFTQKKGVCQDFAHIMISGLRSVGIPARYVSGYLRTLPPPGQPRLQGADATHAWVSVWCGHETGWLGLDPTNNVLVGEDHIVLAVGRDYADVAPVTGMLVGPGEQLLHVQVDVIPSEPGDMLQSFPAATRLKPIRKKGRASVSRAPNLG